jgi:hypothetical protein
LRDGNLIADQNALKNPCAHNFQIVETQGGLSRAPSTRRRASRPGAELHRFRTAGRDRLIATPICQPRSGRRRCAGLACRGHAPRSRSSSL